MDYERFMPKTNNEANSDAGNTANEAVKDDAPVEASWNSGLSETTFGGAVADQQMTNSVASENPLNAEFVMSANDTGERLNKWQFYHAKENDLLRKNFNGLGIGLYIIVGVNLIASLFSAKNNLALAISYVIVSAIMLGLSLGIHLGKSRVCAIIYMVFAAINAVLTLAQGSAQVGWIIIWAGVMAISYTFSYAARYKRYMETGILEQYVMPTRAGRNPKNPSSPT